MTNPAAGAEGIPPADSYVLSRAGDGDVLLVMQGSDVEGEELLHIDVEGGILSVSQLGGGGRRVLVKAGLDAEGKAFLSPLPRMEVVEVYMGPTEDETRLERHLASRVRLTYEGRRGRVHED